MKGISTLLAVGALALGAAGVASADYYGPADYTRPADTHAAKHPNPSLSRIGSIGGPNHFRPHPTGIRGEAY